MHQLSWTKYDFPTYSWTAIYHPSFTSTIWRHNFAPSWWTGPSVLPASFTISVSFQWIICTIICLERFSFISRMWLPQPSPRLKPSIRFAYAITICYLNLLPPRHCWWPGFVSTRVSRVWGNVDMRWSHTSWRGDQREGVRWTGEAAGGGVYGKSSPSPSLMDQPPTPSSSEDPLLLPLICPSPSLLFDFSHSSPAYQTHQLNHSNLIPLSFLQLTPPNHFLLPIIFLHFYI